MNRKKRKEYLIRAFRLYTLLVTLITVLMIILGSLLDCDRVFSYDAFISPLLYALIGTAATAVTWTEKELSIRKLIIRKAIALLLIEGAILFVALKSDTIPTEKNWVVPCLLAGVFAVYVLSHIILYFIDRREAEKISADLARYQENQKDGIS